MKNAVYLVARSVDPYHNLAVEEQILDTLPRNTLVLFIWRGARAVIIGRHQNPWKETDCECLIREGVMLARRISGGGAVYHDLGNLNFSFIADRKLFSVEHQVRAVCAAMARFGVRAAIGARNELLADGLKFSGSAYAYRRTRALHHGTLMIDTDISMFRVLESPLHIPWSRGTESVKSDVVNLRAVAPSLTIENAASSIRSCYEEMTGCRFIDRDIDEVCDAAGLARLHAKNRSWRWLYGATPAFETEMGDGSGLFACVEGGRIVKMGSMAAGWCSSCAGQKERFVLNRSASHFLPGAGPVVKIKK